MFHWGKMDLKFYKKIHYKKVSDRIPPKFNQAESMIRGVYLLSFVVIEWMFSLYHEEKINWVPLQ